CQEVGRDVTRQLLDGNAITHFCSWLVRTKAIKQARGARTWFEVGEDIDLQLRLAQFGRVWHDPRISYFYRIHNNSVTHQQKSHLRQFYELSARHFALQRAQRGYDDLEIGSPPQLPASSDEFIIACNQYFASSPTGESRRSAWTSRPHRA